MENPIKLLVVFAHFNPKSGLYRYVRRYIELLLALPYPKDIVLVSTSTIAQKIEGVEVIERENIGYDFYSYKVGLASKENLSNYSHILFCNDSVIPLVDSLHPIIKRLHPHALAGLSASHEFSYHLQSYFLLFNLQKISLNDIEEFFNTITILDDKAKIIEQYELGVSRFFLNKGYTLTPFVEFTITPYTILRFAENRLFLIKHMLYLMLTRQWHRLQELNITHFFCKHIALHYGFGFIKRDLLTKNPQKVNLKSCAIIMKKFSIDKAFLDEL